MTIFLLVIYLITGIVWGGLLTALHMTENRARRARARNRSRVETLVKRLKPYCLWVPLGVSIVAGLLAYLTDSHLEKIMGPAITGISFLFCMFTGYLAFKYAVLPYKFKIRPTAYIDGDPLPDDPPYTKELLRP